MDVMKAAEYTLGEKPDFTLARDRDGMSIAHGFWLLSAVANGSVEGEKAHRWLGYGQAILVLNGITTLERVKAINHAT